MRKRSAVVIGASGLIGRQLVRLLVSDERYDLITVIVRRSLNLSDQKIKEIILEDFSRLSDITSDISGNDYFCTLGTTIKKAGSKKAFLQVDVEYPLIFGQNARNDKSFRQFLIVSAVGANASSMIFYNRAKGEMEERLQKLGLDALKIFQPSLLLGDRDEFRFLEEVAKIFSNIASLFIIGSKKRVGAIRDGEVAKAMIEVACEDKEGFNRYSPSQMIDIAYK
ncbi:MAG: oxidoreductase [Ekhidna sp.]|nr:oxidoreductase [Ekhidna sp.]